jgi:hypothetical protein
MKTLEFTIWERAQTSALRRICSHLLARSLWPDPSIQLRAAARPANHRRVLLFARAPNGAFSAEVGGVNRVHENSGGRDDHWTAPNSGLTELGVNTLAFDPRDPTAVYGGAVPDYVMLANDATQRQRGFQND